MAKYLLLFVVFTISCTETISVESKFTQNNRLLVGKVLSPDSVYMRYPFRILQSDSSLYIVDFHGSDYYCHRFSYPDLHFEQSYAPRGSGPSEFLDAENIRIDKQGKLYLLDANKSDICVCPENNSVSLKRIKLSKELVRTLDFDIVDDTTFVVPDYTGTHRFNLINMRGQIIKTSFKIPIRDKEKYTANITLAQAWRSFIDYNPHNGIMAMATQLGDVVELYDLKADSIINIVYGESGEPEFIDKGGYAVPNGIMGYSDVHVGTKNIYALFWGRSFKDIRNNPDIIEGGNMLRVFDLKGNPVCQYTLDKYITGFTLDEKKNKIIALDINSNKSLVEYQL